MLNLHVVLAIDRAGLVGDDGETHHGVFDVGFLSQIPGMTVLCPASQAELKQMMRWAVTECDGPVAVRYPRGGDGAYTGSLKTEAEDLVVHRYGKDGAIITYGTLVNEAETAADILAEKGIRVSVIRITKLKTVTESALASVLTEQKHVLIAEEAIRGIGAALSGRICDLIPGCSVTICDLGDSYVTHGSIGELYKKHGLDGKSLADRFVEVLHEN